MNEPTDLISVDDAAQLLGIEPRRIKQLVRDRILFTVPGEDGKPAIPREIIVKSEGKWEPLDTLPGTLTVLADGGFSPQEAVVWLYTPEAELGQTPMQALLEGRQHRVNAIASMLAW